MSHPGRASAAILTIAFAVYSGHCLPARAAHPGSIGAQAERDAIASRPIARTIAETTTVASVGTLVPLLAKSGGARERAAAVQLAAKAVDALRSRRSVRPIAPVAHSSDDP